MSELDDLRQALRDAEIAKQKAEDELADAKTALQRANDRLKQAVSETAKKLSDMLSEANALEADLQASKAEFDAGRTDDFPEPIGASIDALSEAADKFSLNLDRYQQAVDAAETAVERAEAEVSRISQAVSAFEELVRKYVPKREQEYEPRNKANTATELKTVYKDAIKNAEARGYVEFISKKDFVNNIVSFDSYWLDNDENTCSVYIDGQYYDLSEVDASKWRGLINRAESIMCDISGYDFLWISKDASAKAVHDMEESFLWNYQEWYEDDMEELAEKEAEEAKRKAEEEAKRKAEEEAKRKAEEEAKRKAEEALRNIKSSMQIAFERFAEDNTVYTSKDGTERIYIYASELLDDLSRKEARNKIILVRSPDGEYTAQMDGGSSAAYRARIERAVNEKFKQPSEIASKTLIEDGLVQRKQFNSYEEAEKLHKPEYAKALAFARKHITPSPDSDEFYRAAPKVEVIQKLSEIYDALPGLEKKKTLKIQFAPSSGAFDENGFEKQCQMLYPDEDFSDAAGVFFPSSDDAKSHTVVLRSNITSEAVCHEIGHIIHESNDPEAYYKEKGRDEDQIASAIRSARLKASEFKKKHKDWSERISVSPIQGISDGVLTILNQINEIILKSKPDKGHKELIANIVALYLNKEEKSIKYFEKVYGSLLGNSGYNLVDLAHDYMSKIEISL